MVPFAQFLHYRCVFGIGSIIIIIIEKMEASLRRKITNTCYRILVLLRLSKSVPKPWFFSKTEHNRNRGFLPFC